MNKQALLLSVLFLLLTGLAPAAYTQSDCDFSISNYARAVQLHDMGDYGRALQHYDCALLEDPDDSIIPILIATVYEDIESASSAWDAPMRPVCAPARDHGELGAAAFERGDSSGAQAHLHCALLADPADGPALTLMGRIHANLGDAHSAKHYLDRAELARAAADEPSTGFVMPDWLKPYETVPRPDAGGPSAFGSLADLTPAPDETRIHAVLIRARLLFKSAEAAPDARERTRPASQAGDLAPAIQAMLAVTNAAGVTADDYVNLAQLYDINGDLNAAARALASAVDLAPARLDIRCRLGSAYKALGDYARAAAQFFKVIEHEIGAICAALREAP